MFLKSLTLKGFKSFADKTVLEFEPGVTVVVGPNGSGKSNLVDAVAWVLGAQGARSLRGAKMEDVIFAGTPKRPALGRAEVALTIDNSGGLLPIEFNEVTITRTLFRNGDSEYAINGAPCRLLDVQELLSDSGIGRQQHVIIGQGQIDAILNSKPEDRRGVIEEAAGVLKYRKRKERAERRLEATEGNLLRLNDLLREVRRQLAPLARQADAARRYDGLVEELKSIRTHLAGTELQGLQLKLERLRTERGNHRAAADKCVLRLRELDVDVLASEQALSAMGDDALSDMLVRAEALRERARGFNALLAEKQRGIEREMASVADEGVIETLVADAARLRGELAEIEGEMALFAPLADEVATAEAEVARDRAAMTDDDAEENVVDAESVRRELSARRGARDRAVAELDRNRTRLMSTRLRADQLEADHASLLEEVNRAEADAPALSDAAAFGETTRVDAERAAEASDARRLRTAGEYEHARARAETLALALATERAASGAENLSGIDGVVGPLIDHLEVEAGCEAAVGAVLGDALRAVVVRGGDGARRAMERLAAGDASGLLLVLDGTASAPQGRFAPTGARLLAEYVRTRVDGLDAALDRLFDGAILAPGDWRSGIDFAIANPGTTVVTRDGDRFGGTRAWRLGSDVAVGVTQAELDEALERAQQADAARSEAEAAASAARSALATAREQESTTRDALRVNSDVLQGATRALERLDDERRARATEIDILEAEAVEAETSRDEAAAVITEIEARLPELELAESERHVRAEARRTARVELAQREQAVVAQRRDLEVRTAAATERRSVLTARLSEVEARLARQPDAQAKAERRRTELAQRSARYARATERLSLYLATVEALHERLRTQRREQSEAARAATEALEGLRRDRGEVERELQEARELAQRTEVDEAETKLRLETLVERIRAELDMEPEATLDAPVPDVPGGTTMSGRARELERELRLMGPINPLALQEYDELQERHTFLEEQLEDVKQSRRELQRVIKAVDTEIVAVFETAFAEVSRHFSDLFSTLFPGGAGRLFLTNSEDMLNTGIELEARPSGKQVRRLSLLSGGERSLTALGFLFAVARACPSPFYLLDEVEAALDDVNLQRFLDLVHEFRNDSQLLVVSHQKRTMETADCLYGVSMPPGGSSRAISQRVGDVAPVAG
ncbi:MAG: chromosome segregation protein SMC [Acidimicrobiia bacterium]